MLKVILTFVQIITTLYLAGSLARQNNKLDSALRVVEHGYAEFTQKLAEKDISLIHVMRIYRNMFLIGLSVLLAARILPDILFILFSILTYISFVGWMSSSMAINIREIDFGILLRACVKQKKGVSLDSTCKCNTFNQNVAMNYYHLSPEERARFIH